MQNRQPAFLHYPTIVFDMTKPPNMFFDLRDPSNLMADFDCQAYSVFVVFEEIILILLTTQFGMRVYKILGNEIRSVSNLSIPPITGFTPAVI